MDDVTVDVVDANVTKTGLQQRKTAKPAILAVERTRAAR